MRPLIIAGVPEHMNLPWRLALEGGWFTKAGLAVDWRDEPGGTGALTIALDRREIDAATILTEGAIAGIVNGADFALVSLWLASPLVWGIHVRGGSPARRFADFGRPRFAVSRLGSGSHLMAYLLAAREHQTIAADQFVVVGNLAGARLALASGTADMFLWERFMTSPLVISGEFDRIGTIPTPWPSFAVASTRPVDPRLLPAVRVALTQARRLHAAEISTAFGLDEQDAKDWLASVRWGSDSAIEPRVIGEVQRHLLAVGAIDHTVDASNIIGR